MQYQSVCIAVKDLKAARKFYEGLFGLTVFQDYGINIAYDCGIALQQDFDRIAGVNKESIVYKPHNMELYFEEDDFDGFAGRLLKYKDAVVMGGGAAEAPWGQRAIRFYDPDGHIIEVGENMAAVVKRFLNTGMTIQAVSRRMDASVSDLEKLLARG